MKTMQEVLAGHQKVSMGMTSGSPDTCACGVKTYPTPADDEVTVRRDKAFAAHQAAALSAAGYGPVKEAAAGALRDAADELPYLDRPKNMLVRQQDAAAWLRARAAALGADQ